MVLYFSSSMVYIFHIGGMFMSVQLCFSVAKDTGGNNSFCFRKV